MFCGRLTEDAQEIHIKFAQDPQGVHRTTPLSAGWLTACCCSLLLAAEAAVCSLAAAAGCIFVWPTGLPTGWFLPGYLSVWLALAGSGWLWPWLAVASSGLCLAG